MWRVYLFLLATAVADLQVRYSPSSSGNLAARAQSSSANRANVVRSGGQKDDVEATLKQCCEAYGTKSDCIQKMCSYDTTEDELFCAAPDCHNDLKRWVYCASDEKDNTQCCKDEGLADQCLQFCKGETPKLKELFRNDYHYLPCLVDIQKILQCTRKGVVDAGGHENVCLNNDGRCRSADKQFKDERSSQYEGIFSFLRANC